MCMLFDVLLCTFNRLRSFMILPGPYLLWKRFHLAQHGSIRGQPTFHDDSVVLSTQKEYAIISSATSNMCVLFCWDHFAAVILHRISSCWLLQTIFSHLQVFHSEKEFENNVQCNRVSLYGIIRIKERVPCAEMVSEVKMKEKDTGTCLLLDFCSLFPNVWVCQCLSLYLSLSVCIHIK